MPKHYKNEKGRAKSLSHKVSTTAAANLFNEVLLCNNTDMKFLLSLLSVTSFLPCLLGANFSVYWNLFTGHCRRDLDPMLVRYGIIQNKNHNFRGEEIALFYEFNHGRYPFYNKFKIDDPIYGGSPQNLSIKEIKEHLNVSERNITDHIKYKNSSGLGILDFEEWRPLYNMNINSKKVYQEAAIKISGAKHKDSIQEGKLIVTAAQEFNIAARRFIHKSLVQARKLRKKTLWGLYGLPYCNYDAGTKESEKRCSKEFQRFNDKLMYIYNASQALYPSIYLNLKEKPNKARSFRYVQAIVAEAQRIAHKRKPTPLPVYVYTKIEYDPRNYNCSFYEAEDLCTTIILPYRMGVDGIILWSSSNGMRYRCNIITNFLKEKLGPFLQDVVDGKYGERDTDYSDTKVWDYDTVCKPYISNITSYGSFTCDADATTTAQPAP